MINRTMNRTGCVAKGVAHGERIGHELLLLARRARAEGKLSQSDWEKLPTTPEGMVNLLMGQDAEKSLIEALLETYV